MALKATGFFRYAHKMQQRDTDETRGKLDLFLPQMKLQLRIQDFDLSWPLVVAKDDNKSG